MIFRNLCRFKYLVPLRQISKTTVKDNDLTVHAMDGDDKGIIILGLNRATGKNSFNKNLTSALDNALEAVKFDKSVRVVIIRSLIPGIFCAGADLKERLTLTELEVQVFVSKLRSLMTKIEDSPVPVIAAIDGAALGGGLEMALACDIRVASNNAKLGLVETKLAILPGAGGTQRLTRIAGPAVAKELIFTSKILNGQEATEYCIVNYSVPQNENGDSAYQKSLEIARQIIPNGPIGVKMAKIAINRSVDMDINSGLKYEELCYAQVIPTKDRIEGLKAFKEKRKSNYTGE